MWWFTVFGAFFFLAAVCVRTGVRRGGGWVGRGGGGLKGRKLVRHRAAAGAPAPITHSRTETPAIREETEEGRGKETERKWEGR